MEFKINQEELVLLTREAEAAKKRARQKVLNEQANSQTPVKETVSAEEYVRRRNRQLYQDQRLVKEVQKDRIQKSLSEWQLKVGKTFANATVENPKIAERVARIGDEYGRHKTSFLFHGNTMGSGKTWHCYSYINLAIQSGKVTAGQIKMGTETDLLGRIAVGGYKRNELLEELTHPRFQIYFVDDVGQGYFSREDTRTEVWYELIDHVYTHQLTLLLTTNLPVTDQGLGRWVGRRAFDRLKTIIGTDGVIEPSKVNRREAVAEKNEQKYRTQMEVPRRKPTV